MLRGAISVLAIIAASGALAAEPQNPAHAIAQKFAAPSEATAPAVKGSQQKPDALPAAKAVKTSPAPAAPIAGKPAAPPAATVTAEAAKPERPSLDYEMDMLRQARSEQPADNAVKQTPAKSPPAPTAAVPAEPKPQTAAAPSPTPAATQPAAPVTPAVATPAAVATAPATPASPLPAAAAATPPHAVQPVAQAATPAPAAPSPAPTAPAKPAETAATPAAPAAPDKPGTASTLLLALETSSGSGKARSSQSFDPILCLNDNCYVSAGLKVDAVKLAKADALKLKTTEEASPDSCKGMIACVFRNVSVPPGAKLQLLELGSATHEAAQVSDVKPDKTCKVADGALTCDEPIATADFKVWVVLEDTARSAGVDGLEEAVADGLPHFDTSRGGDK